ncbi:DUF805 domain-containing protein [Cohnella endophytica]|uniref:DUF805 domain-containing protein n=1 Tax=Cohnella endophytica TaxID=2419778 RepID=A0A494XXE2_9BACL|nr:DUF805 domain-containing protein [Cohnella endophytica]RKP55152.1 DUF805 domain-containing protein [Cohnella endophytica]
MVWYLKALKNYVGFQGRARRKEYWMFALFSAIVSIVLATIESVANLSSFLTGIYSLAILLPSLAVSFRRLHDTGRSAWWLLISLVPIIGFIVLLVFSCQDSQKNNNRYGANPKN